jgi:hypothetical protein
MLDMNPEHVTDGNVLDVLRVLFGAVHTYGKALDNISKGNGSAAMLSEAVLTRAAYGYTVMMDPVPKSK